MHRTVRPPFSCCVVQHCYDQRQLHLFPSPQNEPHLWRAWRVLIPALKDQTESDVPAANNLPICDAHFWKEPALSLHLLVGKPLHVGLAGNVFEHLPLLTVLNGKHWIPAPDQLIASSMSFLLDGMRKLLQPRSLPPTLQMTPTMGIAVTPTQKHMQAEMPSALLGCFESIEARSGFMLCPAAEKSFDTARIGSKELTPFPDLLTYCREQLVGSSNCYAPKYAVSDLSSAVEPTVAATYLVSSITAQSQQCNCNQLAPSREAYGKSGLLNQPRNIQDKSSSADLQLAEEYVCQQCLLVIQANPREAGDAKEKHIVSVHMSNVASGELLPNTVAYFDELASVWNQCFPVPQSHVASDCETGLSLLCPINHSVAESMSCIKNETMASLTGLATGISGLLSPLGSNVSTAPANQTTFGTFKNVDLTQTVSKNSLRVDSIDSTLEKCVTAQVVPAVNLFVDKRQCAKRKLESFEVRGKKLQLRKDLIRYLAVEKSVKSHVCKVCGTSISTKGNLARHIRLQHTKSASKTTAGKQDIMPEEEHHVKSCDDGLLR